MKYFKNIFPNEEMQPFCIFLHREMENQTEDIIDDWLQNEPGAQPLIEKEGLEKARETLILLAVYLKFDWDFTGYEENDT